MKKSSKGKPEGVLQVTPRVGMDVASIKQGILDNLACVRGKFPNVATRNDY